MILRSIALLTGLYQSITAIVQRLIHPVITEYEIKLDGMNQNLPGTKIAVISDFHQNIYKKKYIMFKAFKSTKEDLGNMIIPIKMI